MLQATTRDVPAFLANGGECGGLIATRDWSDSLGPIEQWPAALKTATAIVLRSPVAMVMLWGADGIMIYNDAYSVFAGSKHPEQLGKPVREGWPEVTEFNDHVMKVVLGGGTLQFRDQELTLYRNQGKAEQVWMDLDYSPVPDDEGQPAGVLAVVIDTSARVLAERRFQLRFALDEQLRAASGPEEVATIAARLVSDQLGGLQVGYSELLEGGEYIRPVAIWNKGEPSPFIGERWRADDYGSHFTEVRQGRDVIVEDVATDERTSGSTDRMRALDSAAFMIMPLIKDGAPVGYFFAVSSHPRHWSKEERSLLREVAERAWASMRRSKAELALRDSREHLEAIFNQTSAGIAEAALDGRLLNANDRYCELLGRSREELLELTVGDLTHPDDMELNQSLLKRLVETGEGFRIDKRYLRPDGSSVWVSNSVSLVKRGPDRAPSILAVCIDIGDRKAAERARQETEERFRNMADNAPVMMWVTDPTGHCTYLNRRWYEFTGQSPGEGEGLGWVQAVHPDDRPIAEKAFLDANGKQKDYHVEFRLRRADGSYRWTLDAAAARFDESGEFMGYVGSVVDIDERRESELAVQDSEQRLRLATAAADIGTWDFDPVGGALRWDDRCKELFGLPPEGHVDYDVFLAGLHPDDREATNLAVQEALAPGGTGAYAISYRTIGLADRVLRWVSANGGAVFEGEGADRRAVRFIGTVIDITDRKKAEQHQRLLIDELSHRAKNLLAIIQSVAQQSFKGAGDQKEMLRAFEGRLGALAAAHGVLTQEKWEAAPLRRIICDTITAVKSDDHRLVLDGPDVTVPPKTGVSVAMAIHELVTNALKYGSFSVEDGRVLIKWRVEEGRLKLEWREEGGPPVVAPEQRGFGSRMIERGLAAELGGNVRIDFRPEGVVCLVDAPMPEIL